MSKIIKLCCGGKGCPTIQKADKTHVTIKDESGGEITIRIEEANMIQKALDEL